MNPHSYEDMAWLHLQDMQREAENRRQWGRRPSATMAAVRGLLAWAVATVRLRDKPAEQAESAPTECTQEIA